MVLVEEVQEDILVNERESDYETDSNASDDVDELSDVDEDDDFDPSSETLYDRISALQQIVPPEALTAVTTQVKAAKEWTNWALTSSGTLAWWVTTSALLLGLPLALAIEDEARITQQEREMQMQSQGQQQLMGGQAQPGATQVMPAGF